MRPRTVSPEGEVVGRRASRNTSYCTKYDRNHAKTLRREVQNNVEYEQ